jgi:hypothetical protein
MILIRWGDLDVTKASATGSEIYLNNFTYLVTSIRAAK